MIDPSSELATRRIITLLQVLVDHPVRGVAAADLIDQVGGYGTVPKSQRDSLSRELKYLAGIGFDIENVSGEGHDARYVLHPGDDRVRLAFKPDELFQLQRAAVLVGVDRLVAVGGGDAARPGAGVESDVPVIDPIQVPDILGDVQRAISSRALVKFEYSGRARTIHPYGLRMAPRGWVLEGWEEESGQAKVFSLHRMSSARIGRPGTASPPERSVRPTLDPLRYELDDPAQAVLRVGTRFRDQVVAVLHQPLRVDPGPERDGEPTELLHYRVTNHTNFLVRVLRLDERVELLGDDRMRAALRRMLIHLTEVA